MRDKLSKIGSRLKKLKDERKEKPLISEDSAINAITEFLDYYDIDIASLQMTENTEVAGERILDALIKYYRWGKLKNQIDEKGKFLVIQTLKSGTTITYSEVKAANKRTMDKLESRENNGKIQTYMGSLGNIGLDGVDQLHATDLAVLEVLGNIFLLA